MGLLHDAPDSFGALEPRRWPVDVYLNDCALNGVLEGTQRRLNDYLQAFDDQINLSDGTVRSLRAGKELISKRTIIVTVPNILFVVDCSESPPAPPQQGLRVEKRAEDTMLSVGPFWIQGQIHIPTAGNINSFMRGGAGSFVPVTDVRISGHEQHNGRTVLVNRTHIRCLLL